MARWQSLPPAREAMLRASRSRELDGILAPVCGPTLVRRARPEEVGQLLLVAQTLIGGTLASEATVRRVMACRPDTLWIFLRHGHIRGGMALLMLNHAGTRALRAGTLDARDPAPALLAPAAAMPAAIYVWAVAHRLAADGIVKIFAKLQLPRYAAADVYAVPITPAGRHWMQGWGFTPVPGDPRSLHHYVRWVNRSQQSGR
jgi:hypothetical protein